MLTKFWKWYERNETFNLGLAAVLFVLQIVHLIWLFGDVVYFRLAGVQLFQLEKYRISSLLILLVDYLEIPAIITTSLVYINEIRKKIKPKSIWFLIFINSQWLHLFWITDEFVVDALTASQTESILPIWAAWIAILIDYLEVPVIYDTLKKFFDTLKKRGITPALAELKD